MNHFPCQPRQSRGRLAASFWRAWPPFRWRCPLPTTPVQTSTIRPTQRHRHRLRAIGCNTAWHLRQRRLNVLLRLTVQPEPASQSTTGAAGFVASWLAIILRTGRRPSGRCSVTHRFLHAAGQMHEGRHWLCRLWNHLHICNGKRLEYVLQAVDQASPRTGTTSGSPHRRAGQATHALPPISTTRRRGSSIPTPFASGPATPFALAKQLADDGVQFQYGTQVTNLLREVDRIVGRLARPKATSAAAK